MHLIFEFLWSFESVAVFNSVLDGLLDLVDSLLTVEEVLNFLLPLYPPEDELLECTPVECILLGEFDVDEDFGIPEFNADECGDGLSSFFAREEPEYEVEDAEDDDESELGDRDAPFFGPVSIFCFSPILFMDNEEHSIPLIGWTSAVPSISEIGTKSTFGFFKLNPFLSNERSLIPGAFEPDNLLLADGDIKPLLPLSNAVAFESLLDAPRMFFRSLDFTFNELPVDNFVIVTEPTCFEPLVGPGELGSLVSEPFEEELEVPVDDNVDFSDPEFKDGSNLSLDEFEQLLGEELCGPVDIESLHLTGEMVTPSFLPLFGGVFDVEPKSLPIASSTLSLFESLLDLYNGFPLISSLSKLLCTLDIAEGWEDSLNVCFDKV